MYRLSELQVDVSYSQLLEIERTENCPIFEKSRILLQPARLRQSKLPFIGYSWSMSKILELTFFSIEPSLTPSTILEFIRMLGLNES